LSRHIVIILKQHKQGMAWAAVGAESTKNRGVWFQLEAHTELKGAGHDPHPDGRTLPPNVRRCCALDYQTPGFLALS
jgi:hypothetical protein